ncbi:hydroxyacid dehydrogenase [Mycolicibacterium aromaticivorans JS19b1 = JCM 16368]|uniref:Hydroxyacid dehydrogenase n=1 Tax=Mycolicibacterium aromaticivorans JS19b1 = JCM 16368 TaxID=1440774 RepID=A0A064CQH0_9MYCO|nr:2-hydroxyacid dehydrogenase [Mycolicibacterium aromaticivorans]KDF00969.1 hydroxyacid dehydrogenase [Mycolicibacterium aromaticivorans JS19b1 = JCM 16368]
MAILVVGRLEPSLENQLTAKHTPLRQPVDAQQADEVTVIVCGGRPGVDAALMDSLPALGAIVNFGAGYDAIDVDAARERGIGVSNTPDVLNDTVADTALGLILDSMRRFSAADRYVRAGRWATEGPFPYTRDLSGSRVGILGLGRIGSAIAARLRGFDCAIAYHNRHELPDSPYRYAASPVKLAATVDVLVVATAGGSDTAQLVDREVLEALGPDGFLINVARGSVVDQDALIEFLEAGRLAGAGLDVYAAEPDVPVRLCELDNVVLLPHMGSATLQTRTAMATLAMRNLEEFLASGQLVTPV